MGDFTQELKSNKILTSEDIIRLRTYIKNKYPNLNKNQQADILISSIKKIIDQYLESFSIEKQSKIKDELFKNTLLIQRENILLYDLFKVIISEYDKEDIHSVIVLNWVNAHLNEPINKDDLLNYKYNLPFNKKVVNKKQHDFKSSFQPSPIKVLFTGLLLIMFLSFALSNFKVDHLVDAKEESIIIEPENKNVKLSHLPDYFLYKDINENKLKAYLKNKDSLLEEEPYFSSIINTAKEFDLNPLLLFAITGQEQGFVPKSNPLSYKIANNPYNVFFSWQKYNTDIVDSSQIAARTIINLSKDRPEDINPFQWINRKYAEDQNWYKGVQSIFNHLEEEIHNFSSY